MTKIITMQDAIQTGRAPIARGIRLLMEDDRGGALADYAIITAVLAMAMLGTLQTISSQAGKHLNTTANSLTAQSITYSP